MGALVEEVVAEEGLRKVLLEALIQVVVVVLVVM
jgi:hypothetical protein